MSRSTPRVVVIAGPTATGKTAVAVELATRLGGELVGADSVQVYRGFDIGAAKPTAAELRGVPHHLIDVRDPDAPLDAMGYAALADAAIADIAGRGRTPIVIGGTGLWLRALLRGLVDLPPVDLGVRAALMRAVDAEGAPALHARLASVDPRSAEAVHPNDAVRVVRALEVYEQTGEALGALRAAHALGEPRYDALTLVVDRPAQTLSGRIEARVRAMLAAGWLDEVRALRARWGDQARALRSVGYRQLVEHLRGERTLAEAQARAVRATRIYARRQRTWFRGEPGIDWRGEPEQVLDRDTFERVARHVGRPAGSPTGTDTPATPPAHVRS